MASIAQGPIGNIHLLSSAIALGAGLFILLTTKGTKLHKRIGYLYALSMIVLNATAFMIYNLYGKFGLFHWLAVVSSLTLLAGLFPVISKRPRNYLLLHFNFMYWSVIGLYAAFVAETFSRLPNYVLTESGEPMTVFYKWVGIGMALVMTVGVLFFIKFRPIWTTRYSDRN